MVFCSRNAFIDALLWVTFAAAQRRIAQMIAETTRGKLRQNARYQLPVFQVLEVLRVRRYIAGLAPQPRNRRLCIKHSEIAAAVSLSWWRKTSRNSQIPFSWMSARRNNKIICPTDFATLRGPNQR
jgi:hypothetical protein